MFHFVYLTTNLINGKQYIGDHSSISMDDGYLGSGNLILKAKKKYGSSNFKREILESFNSKEDSFYAQARYIEKYNTLAPAGYNLSPTGGMEIEGRHSEKTIEKIRKARKKQKMRSGWNHSNETIELIKSGVSKANKGRVSPNKGNRYSEESRRKISMNHSRHNLGKKFSMEHRRKISESHNSQGENNGMFGKNHSLESIEKMKLSLSMVEKMHCKYCNSEFSPAMYKRWHGKKCKNYEK